MVDFNHIPANIRTPLFYPEVDESRAGTTVLDQPCVIFGHPLAGTPGTRNALIPIGSAEAAADLYGAGAPITRSVKAFRDANANSTLFVVAVDEPAAGVAATGSIAITASSPAAGTISLYIAGQLVAVAVATTDTDTALGDKIAAAINAETSLPVTAENATGTVTLTARWKGLTGNDITVFHSTLGHLGGQALPSGVSLAITPMAGGTGTPDLVDGIDALGEELAEHCMIPWTDTASLDSFMGSNGEFSEQERWSYERQLYGHVHSAVRGTLGDLVAAGNARNDFMGSIISVNTEEPMPIWEKAACATGVAAGWLLNDPARPLTKLPLPGLLPAPKEKRFSNPERNTLLFEGIATGTTDSAGIQKIERYITLYQRNAFGSPDNAFLDITTVATYARVIRELKRVVEQQYPNHKIAKDGTAFGPGQAITTPKQIKSTLVAHYRELEYQGLVENADAFKEHLVIKRDETDPTRVNVHYPPDFVNPLMVFAVKAQFRLQFSGAIN